MASYYDKLTFSEKSRFRQNQIKLANIQKNDTVLDIGCGPGTLSNLSKITTGNKGQVCGIDIAPKMIKKARTKASKYNLEIDFRIASVDNIPYPDNHFNIVISSLMFHHLPIEIKEKGLKEIYRVLKPEGRFFFCDFCQPNPIMIPLAFLLFIWLKSTRYQFFGHLIKIVKSTGFKKIQLVKKGLFLTYYLIEK